MSCGVRIQSIYTVQQMVIHEVIKTDKLWNSVQGYAMENTVFLNFVIYY